MFWLVRKLVKFASFLISLALVAGVAALGFVYWQSTQQDTTPTDAIVVMGAAQFNGTPSPVLANRLDQALDLAANQVAPLVITVGGKRPGDRFTEASAGRNYLMDGGLTSDQVIAVPTGSDTLTSCEAVAKLAHKMHIKSFTVVSDPAHVARVSAILGSLGFKTHNAPTTRGPGAEFSIDYLARETAGLLHFWVVSKWSL